MLRANRCQTSALHASMQLAKEHPPPPECGKGGNYRRRWSAVFGPLSIRSRSFRRVPMCRSRSRDLRNPPPRDRIEVSRASRVPNSRVTSARADASFRDLRRSCNAGKRHAWASEIGACPARPPLDPRSIGPLTEMRCRNGLGRPRWAQFALDDSFFPARLSATRVSPIG